MASPRPTFAVSRALLIVALAAMPASALASGLVIFGTSDEGSGSNAFERIIDFETGHERTTVVHGQSSEQNGFDGILWNYVNGAGNVIDLPSEAADRRAEMWIRQMAFRISGKPGEQKRPVSLPKTSPIELTFDPATRCVSSALFQGDYGPVTFTFGDWRRVGSYDFPFRQEMKDGEGERIDLAQSVRLISRVDPNLLTRPAPAPARLAEGAVTIPFKTVGASKTHILVDASIDGTPAEFVFDTGGANILTTDAAKRLGITSAGGINVGGVGEDHDAGGFGLVKAVSVGPATLNDQAFIIIPSFFPPVNGKPSPTAGLLGYEFLAHFVTTIDYRAETITFREKVPADQRGVRLPFVSDGHGISVHAMIDGKRGLVSVDTGDGGTLTLFPAFTAAAGIDPGTGPTRVIGSGAGGEVKGRVGTIGHFQLAGVDFPRLPVEFSDAGNGAFASRSLAGNLGAAVIRCFRVTFDYPHHQMWLEPQLDTPLCAATNPKPTAAASAG